MKKTLPLIAVALLFSFHGLLAQTASDNTPAQSLQNKLMQEAEKSEKLSNVLQKEWSILQTRTTSLLMQAGMQDQSEAALASVLGEDSASEYFTIQCEFANLDVCNPAAVRQLQQDMQNYEVYFMRNHAMASQKFAIFGSEEGKLMDLKTMLVILSSIQDKEKNSDFNILIGSLFPATQTSSNKVQVIAQFCLYEYLNAYMTVHTVAPTDANIAALNALQVQLVNTNNTLPALLVWQAQVIEFENTLPAPQVVQTAPADNSTSGQ